MNERKLTEEQIDDLYEFCYFSSVPYYDVQVELVDHLASTIEEFWKTKPETPFEEAVYIAREQFGGKLGFYNIRIQKEKALKKKYRRMLWRFVAEFYRLPKIILTAVISIVTFFGLKYAPNDAWLIGPLLVLVAAFSDYFIFFYFPKHIKIKREGYAFLLNEVLQNGVAHKTIITSGAILGISARLTHLSTVGSIVFSALFSLYLVLLYADCVVLPQKVKAQFYHQFPQLVKA